MKLNSVYIIGTSSVTHGITLHIHMLLPYRELRLAYSIGSGYTSVKHARMVGEVYDSDLLRYPVCTKLCL